MSSQPGGTPDNSTEAINEDAMRLREAKAACAGLTAASRFHAQYAHVLVAQSERDEAVAILNNAMKMPVGAAVDYEAIAFAAFGLNEHELARDAYAKVVDLAPDDGLARYNLATGERNLGRVDEAHIQCEAALARDPTLHQAALLRSQLRTQTDQANNIAWLRQALDKYATQPAANIFLNYALGKELEDLSEYRVAFAHFRSGARARRQTYSYNVDQDLRIMRRIEEEFMPPVVSESARPHYAGRYGFVLGLPRSGTTLVERILTGHPGITSNGETDNFSNALLRNTPPGNADIFSRAASAKFAKVGFDYDRLAAKPETRMVIEKLPLNFLYVGAIARALPEAPIVLVRRHPVDNCLGMFTTLFGTAYPFSYDLDELADYYSGYHRLVQHWKHQLGARILELPYEGLVREPEKWGPLLAAHLGIAWCKDALHVERNSSASATASAIQVRQPIYTTAAGRWARYRPEMQDLIMRLQQKVPGFDLETTG